MPDNSGPTGLPETRKPAPLRWPCLPASYQPTPTDLVNLAAAAADRNGLYRPLFYRLFFSARVVFVTDDNSEHDESFLGFTDLAAR